ncbi:MAG: endo alpha-1,4 polygalactosaminidase, partial [Candidatus Thorarchaeota archaeon]|nr:endo alpha-1,4 polygalactosaminidase [Candidatus Thorarchaeota archaeon]
RSAVNQLHESSGANVNSKIVIAYIDIGEAEDWRWYWDDNWTAPSETSLGNPDFLISVDPDGWEGNYPVAFWDDRWKNIILYDEGSSIQQILDDGFDGIYMDWIEAYEHEPVMTAGESEGLDTHQEMIDFISEIRAYCRAQNPDFLLIAQNALDIYEDHVDYFDIIDAVAQEHVLFDGVADTEWGEEGSGDARIPESGDEGYSTQWYVEYLDRYLAEGKTVFVVDYALNAFNIAESYAFADSHGYIGFVTQIALSQLPNVHHPDYPL